MDAELWLRALLWLLVIWSVGFGVLAGSAFAARAYNLNRHGVVIAFPQPWTIKALWISAAVSLTLSIAIVAIIEFGEAGLRGVMVSLAAIFMVCFFAAIINLAFDVLDPESPPMQSKEAKMNGFDARWLRPIAGGLGLMAIVLVLLNPPTVSGYSGDQTRREFIFDRDVNPIRYAQWWTEIAVTASVSAAAVGLLFMLPKKDP